MSHCKECGRFLSERNKPLIKGHEGNYCYWCSEEIARQELKKMEKYNVKRKINKS